MIHLYWGNGKGKTTAAMGLALRALGHGRRVVIVQFLKDGNSGEIEPLRRLGASVYACPNAKFTWLMDGAERLQARDNGTAALQRAIAEPCDLLILDEACAAYENDLVDRDLLQHVVSSSETSFEVVLTGRTPAGWMQAAADYSTEMRACQHPYEKGVPAREGIEY
ncbi:cob(I)yrinic acid a,c-diamide adenosyltransferase [Subdoligranulum variabile]|uniref:Cob(I)yrinic acid a,c-diamide adenosyltransferase n=1 Tax=Subdoligranulum variabile DSM 15176 TaxID=411471 RepID=D1PKS3_9FIRM|nr:cob(I)yrinic acid a,c-diamide adenosyltransferase [Subdoligranulum variabile]EFB76581.1 putative cob(I)yrinic acid a,c-diamide adenosyltransferase [Subdoligranulum variabile DSM 15176]UWP68184.1 cob(I)yrinic acid a,c-diamide adenosyltransferase [Subdoligranulum variabile]